MGKREQIEELRDEEADREMREMIEILTWVGDRTYGETTEEVD